MEWTENFDGSYTCHSDSGNSYRVTDKSCGCKGFQFRRYCKHMTEAKEKGILDKMKIQRFPNQVLLRSPYIIRERKKAIIYWFTKNKIKFTDSMVDKIEAIMTVNTPMQECIERIL
jgi:hypothetical protein